MLGQSPSGTYPFTVEVIGKGFATMNTATTLTFSLSATTINPTVSGTGGGLPLTINGEGFSSQSTVKIDNIDCPVTSYTYNQLTCVIPSNVIF